MTPEESAARLALDRALLAFTLGQDHDSWLWLFKWAIFDANGYVARRWTIEHEAPTLGYWL